MAEKLTFLKKVSFSRTLMKDRIVIKTKITGLVKGISREKRWKVNNVSEDFAAALDKKVKYLLEESVGRAQANGRRTLMPKDL